MTRSEAEQKASEFEAKLREIGIWDKIVSWETQLSDDFVAFKDGDHAAVRDDIPHR